MDFTRFRSNGLVIPDDGGVTLAVPHGFRKVPGGVCSRPWASVSVLPGPHIIVKIPDWVFPLALLWACDSRGLPFHPVLRPVYSLTAGLFDGNVPKLSLVFAFLLDEELVRPPRIGLFVSTFCVFSHVLILEKAHSLPAHPPSDSGEFELTNGACSSFLFSFNPSRIYRLSLKLASGETELVGDLPPTSTSALYNDPFFSFKLLDRLVEPHTATRHLPLSHFVDVFRRPDPPSPPRWVIQRYLDRLKLEVFFFFFNSSLANSVYTRVFPVCFFVRSPKVRFVLMKCFGFSPS